MGKRKGSLKETLSYAMYRDNPQLYSVGYRDKDAIKRASLADFLTREEFSDIPITRIVEIRKEETLVWQKGQKEVKR